MARTTTKKKKRTAGSVLLSQRNKGIRKDAVTPRHASISPRAGRTLIRAHHALQKRLAQALSRSDHEAAQSIRAEIDVAGGLDRYQMASVSVLPLL
jgi:25S rRNA (adenine2142-N1)-methyltransferase